MVKASFTFAIVALAMVHLLASLGPGSEAVVTCGDLASPVAQCASFAIGSVSEPTSSCCSEVKQLQGKASTTADRRQVCYCLKQYAPSFPNLQDNLLSTLPSKCGVSLSYTLSVYTNCESIY